MHDLARRGVLELKQVGMQRLAAKIVDNAPCVVRQPVRLGLESRAIFRVANERVADMGHVHPDLVGAAGLQTAFDERGEARRIRLLAIALDHLVMRDRLAGVVAVLALDRPLGPVAGTAERRVDHAAKLARPAPDGGPVGALQRSRAAVIGKLV